MSDKKRPPELESCPRSATVSWINWVGVFSMLGTAWILRQTPSVDPLLGTVLAAAAFAVPLIVLEFLLLRGRRETIEGIRWGRIAKPDAQRIAVKLLGLLTTFAIIGLAYAVFPEYRAALFDPFWDVLEFAIPVVLLCAPAYFWFVDGRMSEPRDGYWHLGALMLGRAEDVDLAKLKQHALGWLVKGFFLPLMFAYFHGNLNHLRNADFALLDFMGWYHFLYDLLIFVDVGVIVVGYAMTMRLFDNHIRSAEPTWSGWIPAIMCYQPFWGLIGPNYFSYRSDIDWFFVLEGYPTLRIVFAAIILGLMAIYTWASVCFGLRFSNLTHRGIITNGPYRWSKHPAYVSKNLSWWFEAMPFIAPLVMGFRGQGWNGHWNDALLRTLRLIGVNLIYYIRARTEERHLSQDPLYIRYALWMEQHSVMRFAVRFFRFARFAPPTWWIEASERTRIERERRGER